MDLEVRAVEASFCSLLSLSLSLAFSFFNRFTRSSGEDELERYDQEEEEGLDGGDSGTFAW